MDSDYPSTQSLSFKIRILELITVHLLGSVFSGTPSTPFEVVFQAHLKRVKVKKKIGNNFWRYNTCCLFYCLPLTIMEIFSQLMWVTSAVSNRVKVAHWVENVESCWVSWSCRLGIVCQVLESLHKCWFPDLVLTLFCPHSLPVFLLVIHVQ